MAFDAIRTSCEVLMRTGKRSGRYLGICSRGQEKADAQNKGAAEKSDS
jgi:hypothetical protein